MKKGALAMTVLGVILFLLSGTGAYARVHTESVDYSDGETALRGFLAYDEGIRGKRPAILIVHEWWGLNEHARNKAVDLAKEGYITFALDMYGGGKQTEHPERAGEWSGFIRSNKDIGQRRFMAAYDLINAHPMSREGRISAIGYCFGGHVVLSMAVQGKDLEAVVSFHGSFPGEPAATGTVRAKILVCHGADDPTISQDQVLAFQESLRKADADWQFISYGGAKHSFTNPDADKRGIPALGYDPAADERSWRAMLALFREVYGE